MVGADELLTRYRRKGYVYPKSVLDALGAQRYWANLYRAGLYQPVRPDIYLSDVDVRDSDNAIADRILTSPLFWWTAEMVHLAMRYDVPEMIAGVETFPFPCMTWLFPGNLLSDGRRLVSIFFLRGEGQWILDLLSIDDKGYPRSAMTVKDGPVPMDSTVAVCIALSAFMSSKMTVTTKHRAGDHRRYRHVVEANEVNVITLRAQVREAVHAERVGNVYTRRWLVRGHIRAQWYPSSQSHKPIWIAPHLKGPADAPLKLPVYAVTR